MFRFAVCCTLLTVFTSNISLWAQEQDSNDLSDLFDMSIEDLMNIEVTSVSKKEEKAFETPAAVYVITQEDIRRSGATCIPEALRMAPGLQVSRINSNSWAITSRGFQDQFANKLLVMIDGRSVYNTQYSGVFWDSQDVVLEDVERIEVVRGPGGTLWGANAVNGVINIITKKAKDTQGTLISGGAGNEEEGFGTVRYGDKAGENAHYRVYGKYFNRDTTPLNTHIDRPGGLGGGLSDSGTTRDRQDMSQGGFRIDWDKTQADQLTLQGDAYYGEVGMTASRMSFPFSFDQGLATKTLTSGENLLGRWTHVFSETSDMALQMYYDKIRRIETNFRQTDDTYDVDFQHRFAPGPRHELVWGLGYRFNTNLINSNTAVTFDPERRNTNLFSGFVQDEIGIVQNLFSLILGSKFEHNDYTGFEFQPSARILWTPDNKNTAWAAVSQAVRTPSRTDNDLRVDDSIVSIRGSDSFESEDVTAYELGYRTKPFKHFYVDLAAFYNVYDNLATEEISMSGAPGPPGPANPITVLYDNKMSGETYGGEITANWNVAENWKLATGYTFTQIQLHLDGLSTDMFSEDNEGNSAHNQFHLRSYINLPGDVEFDTMLYYQDNLSAMNTPSHIRLDARLGWHINKNMELSLIAQNLLDGKHPEFTSSMGNTDANGEIERSFIGKLTCRF